MNVAENISRLGVIGAGQMGSGIAQVAAQSGIDVVIVDAQRDWADKGRKKIDAALDKLVQRGKL
ncbi:MAG: NAD(P)-binding domain-containing protein, partial [Myxococcales bacterium]|nr:NAD(P)-binding domain-containing protein [Myxococcales bacterium]